MVIVLSVLLVLQAIMFAVVVWKAYKVVISNPNDPAIVKQRQLKADNLLHEFDATVGSVTGEKLHLYCSICKAYVHESTKHCGGCNRCCHGFDHHCDWLNNCIGVGNYKLFRQLIAWYLVFILVTWVLVTLLFTTDLMTAKDGKDKYVWNLWKVIVIYIEMVFNFVVSAFTI